MWMRCRRNLPGWKLSLQNPWTRRLQSELLQLSQAESRPGFEPPGRRSTTRRRTRRMMRKRLKMKRRRKRRKKSWMRMRRRR
jgi:hypothetical protein